MRRRPAVAGSFYPADPRRLRETVESLIDRDAPKEAAQALRVPHAGYVYSGGCAGRTYSAARLPQRFLILCPNHTGLGAALATDDAEAWDTPLGAAHVDADLVERLMRRCRDLPVDDRRRASVVADPRAHAKEHSLEVQLPFLQALRPDGFRFAPLCVGTAHPGLLEALGAALADVIAELDPPPLVVISSDMTHYESAEAARRKDQQAIARLEAVDAAGLHDVVRSEEISMCGFAPAVAALGALGRRGVVRGRLVQYTHSGVVTGDDRHVVAYAGMVFA